MTEPKFEEPHGCRLTQSIDGTRLYIHLMEYPLGKLELHNMSHKIEYAQFLHDGSELLILQKEELQHGDYERFREGVVYISLPIVEPDVIVPVIEVFLQDPVKNCDENKNCCSYLGTH